MLNDKKKEEKGSKMSEALRSLVKPKGDEEAAEKKKLIKPFVFLIVAFVGFMLAITHPAPNDTVYFFQILFGAAMFGSGLWFFIAVLEYIRKRPKLAGLFLLFLAVTAFVYLYQSRKTGVDEDVVMTVPIIQDHLVELVVAKTIGNGISTGKGIQPGASWADVAYRVTKTLERMDAMSSDVPDRLDEYFDIGKSWGQQIVAGTKSRQVWAQVSNDLKIVSVNLTEAEAEALLEPMAGKIAELKAFGDAAIARGDRETMRYVFARAFVMGSWLDGIQIARTDGVDGLAFIPSAHAVTVTRVPYIGWCKRGGCRSQLRRVTQGVYKSAYNYVAGEPEATTEWRDAWTNAADIMPGPFAEA
ncbi:MAG TPA: hypothetical protein VN397_02350, partial [Candidatus Methylomirabilis sp.]|nr:hypothetical protein [Candidatus Methylomirabilis sp.]